jgi:hypothetical protein
VSSPVRRRQARIFRNAPGNVGVFRLGSLPVIFQLAQFAWLPDFGGWPDTTVYLVMGSVGSVLFLIKVVMTLFAGVDDGADFDTDGGFDAHGADFHFFSLLSILSFMMGAGWMGLACRQEWGFASLPAAMIASAFGFGLMLLSSAGMYQMRKLSEEGSYNLEHCIGKTGRVYLKIPAKGKGMGQIQIAVDGRHKTLAAVSANREIESFATVKVVGLQDDQTLIVEAA